MGDPNVNPWAYRMDVGLYAECDYNFRGPEGWEDSWPYWAPSEAKGPPCYGVADSVDQFIELYGKFIEESPHSFAVGFTMARRSNQPAQGGWRWEKWGRYIGTQDSKADYLYDEPTIESVVVFSVVRKPA